MVPSFKLDLAWSFGHQLCLGEWIPWLRLRLSILLLHIGPSTPPWLLVHSAPPGTIVLKAPPGSFVPLAPLWSDVTLPAAWTSRTFAALSVPPPLWFHRGLPSLRLRLGPQLYRVTSVLQYPGSTLSALVAVVPPRHLDPVVWSDLVITLGLAGSPDVVAPSLPVRPLTPTIDSALGLCTI